MGLNDHYRSVSAGEFDNLPDKTPGKSGWGKQSWLVAIATGTLCIAIVAAVLSTLSSAVVSYTSKPASATSTAAAVVATATPASQLHDENKAVSEAPIQNCGVTADQARANGCVFDVMMQLWTPKDCFDETLSNRFLEVGNWTWYADSSAAKVYTLDEMRKGEHDFVYVDQAYHITHCIYAWEKLVRAMRNQEPLITELISYDHVIHCRHKTLQRTDGGSAIRGVRAPTGYTMCAPYDTWKNHLPANEHSSNDK